MTDYGHDLLFGSFTFASVPAATAPSENATHNTAAFIAVILR